jgi:thiol-disulfide isomerase/thioredoxin
MARLPPLVLAVLALSCGGDASSSAAASQAKSGAAAKAGPKKVGYDIRRLRPRDAEPLAKMFDDMRSQAVQEGKDVAVLFSADWCEPCRVLDLELGNMHPAEDIGHVRILEIKEEDWSRVTRMNELNELRRRWSAPLGVYPLFVLLDADGQKIEEMPEAKARLEDAGAEATIPAWFRGVKG